MPTAVVEDYAKAIYKMQTETEAVSTSALAERTGTSAAAVTKMLKHLAALRLITYTPYHGARLTPSGEKIALEVIRHHRLLELYLAQAMGYSWDQVDAEAEKLEHVISEDFETRIDALLGHPQICPHGDPIPGPDGTLTERRLDTLAECACGQTVRIARVRDSNADILRALASHGLLLQAEVRILERNAVTNQLTVEVDGQPHILDARLTASVFVVPMEERPHPGLRPPLPHEDMEKG